MADMVRRVPPEAAVSAGANVHPHLSQRPTIYVFPELARAEYVLIDVLGDPAPLDVAGQRFRIDQMVNGTGEWGIVTGFDGLLLLKKGELNRALPERLTSFARVEIARGRRIDVDFGDGLRLLSVETAPTESFRGRRPTVRLVAYWRAERLLDRGLLPTLFITDAAGRVVFADAHPAATAWLPPDEWTPGQIIRVEYAAAPLEDLELAFLKLGVSVRNERGEISGLLPAAIPPDMLPGRLSSDGTIVQVATLRRG